MCHSALFITHTKQNLFSRSSQTALSEFSFLKLPLECLISMFTLTGRNINEVILAKNKKKKKKNKNKNNNTYSQTS